MCQKISEPILAWPMSNMFPTKNSVWLWIFSVQLVQRAEFKEMSSQSSHSHSNKDRACSIGFPQVILHKQRQPPLPYNSSPSPNPTGVSPHLFLSNDLLEKIAHTWGTDTCKDFHKLRSADAEEGHAGLTERRSARSRQPTREIMVFGAWWFWDSNRSMSRPPLSTNANPFHKGIPKYPQPPTQTLPT